MSRTLTTQDVSWFLDMKEKDQLNLDPPYQRRNVWSSRDKRFFIDTIPQERTELHRTQSYSRFACLGQIRKVKAMLILHA